MKRIVKKPDVRRLEIMRAAEQLFKEKGYTKTSVESIINKAGIAKGTFYYYFKAKSDILQALVEQTSINLKAYFNTITEREDLTAIEKLQLMLRGPKKKKITSSIAMKIIHKSENRELQEKLNIQSVKIIAPLIAKVLDQGKNEDIFKFSPSVEIIQIIIAGSQFVLDSGLFNWTTKKRFIFLQSIEKLFELLIGTKPGALNFISKE